MSENSVTLKFAYNNTDQTRQYKISEVEAGALSSVKQKVLAFNASMSGTDFFIADEYDVSDPNNPVGTFRKITEAKAEETTVENIPLN